MSTARPPPACGQGLTDTQLLFHIIQNYTVIISACKQNFTEILRSPIPITVSRVERQDAAGRRFFIQLHIFIPYIFRYGYVQILSVLRFYAIIMRSVFLRRGV